jgi:hypothetical protein
VTGESSQAAGESLLSPGDEAALWPPAMVPDPEIMTQYVTGVSQGLWHAVHRGALGYAIGVSPHRVAAATCGALVRVSKHGVYDRTGPPVAYSPCPACAWHVAIAAGSTGRELRLISPGDRESAAVARCGVTPLITVAVCRAILAAAGDADCPEVVVRQLAAATAHRPDLAVDADCLEGGCAHRPERLPAGEARECDYPGAEAVCWECSLRSGPWDGEYEGRLLEQCMVPAPCGVLAALAVHYGLIAGSRRARRMRMRRGTGPGG